MLKKPDIIKIMTGLNFDSSMYTIGFGAALVLYGVRETTHDIDISCKSELINKLKEEGYTYTLLPDGKGKIEIGEEIEMYESDLQPEKIFIEGLPVLTLQTIMEIKLKKGREKDLYDVELIKKYISEQK